MDIIIAEALYIQRGANLTKKDIYANIGSEIRCPECGALLFKFLRGTNLVVEIKCKKCKSKIEFHLENQK